MDQLKQVPGFRRWKKDRKHFIRILLVMSLSFFLMEFSFLLSDSLETTLDQRRKNAYGEWQFALLNLDPSLGETHTLDQNPFIEHFGYIWSQGMLANDGLDGDYGVGGIDEDAKGISRIQVIEGHFPEKAGEAAIEASLLNHLGGSGELGETIHLELVAADVNGKRVADAEVKTMDVTVCGIIADYTVNWCISNRALLPGILMTEESFSDWETDPYKCFLMLSDRDWSMEEMEQDLRDGGLSQASMSGTLEEINSRLTEGSRKLVRNLYTYPKYTADTVATVMNAVRSISGFLATVILGITVLTSVNSRREEWQALTLLGANRQRLKGLLFQEALLFAMISMVLGIGGALLIFAAALPLSSSLLGFPLSHVFSGIHLLTAIGLGCGIVAVTYLVPFLQMKSLSRLHMIAKKKKIKRERKGRESGAVTFHTLWMRQWKTHPWLAVAQLVIMCGVLILPGIGIKAVKEQSGMLECEMTNYGDSYTLANVYSNASINDGIRKKELENINLLYGVSGYAAYQYTGSGQDFFVDISSWMGTPYQEAAVEDKLRLYRFDVEDAEARVQDLKDARDEMSKELYQEQLREAEKYQRTLEEKEEFFAQGKMTTQILTVNSEETLQPFLRNLDDGEVNLEDFFDGKSVILALPAQVEASEEFKAFFATMLTMDQEALEIDQADGRQIISETEIPVGALLDVSYQTSGEEEKKQTVRIDGILRNMPWQDMKYNLLNISLPSYGLICSETFLESFSWPVCEKYQAVWVNASSEAGYGTDTQVGNMLSGASGMQYENHREKTSQLRQELYVDIVLYSAICGLGTLLLLAILSGVSKNASQYQNEAMQTMEYLGIRRQWKVSLQMSQTAILGIAATGAAVMILSGIRYRKYYLEMKAIENEYIRSFSINVGFSMIGYLLLCVVFWMICMLISNGISKKVSKKRKKI